jgi:hypothetical protein
MAGRRARPITTLAVLAACLASVGAVSPYPAARSPQCGDTITTNVRLRADLTCLGDGLIVGADKIVIDLGGHTVMADRATTVASVGIKDDAGHRNVTIRNGIIRNFTVGVRLNGSQATDLVNLQVLAQRGGDLGGITEVGLQLSGTTGITVRDGRIVINNPATEIETSGGDLLISGTTISGANPSPANGSAILSGDVTIEQSSLVRMAVEWTGGLVVEDSQLTYSNIAAATDQSGSLSAKLTGNTFSGGSWCCIGHTVSAVTILGEPGVEIIGVEISRNTIADADAAGAFIQTSASTVTGMVISGNTFSNNGHRQSVNSPLLDINGSLVDDGLHITVPPGTDITVANNHTSNNADYGIEAQPGTVIDGGGNVSSNDPSGCLGVTCG